MTSKPENSFNLIELYRAELQALDYQEDPAQIELLQELQRIADGLMALEHASVGLMPRLLRKFQRQAQPVPKGLYLWGGVGRGKTFLVDLLFNHLPVERKKRVHFHRFMLSVHQRLAQLKSTRDPLSVVAAEIASETRLLCFDELFVSDITDAMVLAGLFRALIGGGVVLIITSNTEVSNLYRDGLQRERFVPAIKLLQQHCVVHQMGGNTDYRLRTLEQAETYITPHAGDTDKVLEKLFRKLAGEEEISVEPLDILGREIAVRLVSEGLAWFDFHALCGGPRSKADYAELSRYYHTLILSEIPILGVENEDPARRFVELVDELYDRQVNVIISAAALPDDLYQGNRLAHGFLRTASRLQEFTSPQYMALPHRP